MPEQGTHHILASQGQKIRGKVFRFTGKSFLALVTLASAAAILFILVFIFLDALPFFREFGIGALFESQSWRPTADPRSFGAAGIFVGTGLVTLGSCLVAIPLGIAAAICLSDVLPFNLRQVAKPVVELLASIPSIAYGFFALVLFAPLLQEHGGVFLAVLWYILSIPIAVLLSIVFSDMLSGVLVFIPRKIGRLLLGLGIAGGAFAGIYAGGVWLFNLPISSGVNAMNASIILAFMALPTIVSVCEDALFAVGRELREGSYALGATRAESIVKVVMPAAKGGIIAAVILGVMRAVGETMVVLMAAGNSFEIPVPWYDFLSGVRTLTATIALEMGNTVQDGIHYHALFALGFCLLAFTFILNMVSEWVSRRSKFSQG